MEQLTRSGEGPSLQREPSSDLQPPNAATGQSSSDEAGGVLAIEQLRRKALSQSLTVGRIGSWAWDFVNNIGGWDSHLYEIFGREPSDQLFSYETFLEFVHPDDREAFDETVQHAIQERGEYTIDFRGILPDGSTRWYSNRGRVEMEGGRAIGMIGTIQDVDDRRRTEEALRDSQVLLRQLVDNSESPTFIKHRDGAYLFVNRAWVEATGLDEEMVLGKTDDELFPPDVAASFCANDAQAMEGRAPVHRREHIWQRDGEEHTYSVVKFPLCDRAGDVMGVCGTSTDITDSLRSEQARAEERERIATDIHDDSVQVMASVALRLETLARSVEDPDVHTRLASLSDAVRGSMDRLRKLMFDLKSSELEAGGLIPALTDFLQRAQAEHGLGFSLQSSLDADPVLGVSVQLYRIAREAIANIVKHANANRIDMTLEQNGHEIRMTIADDGIGFCPAATSPEGHIGLSSMRARAEAAGGHLEIESSPGNGSVVTVWLPHPASRDND